jgi:hypothetical protein
VGPWWKGIVFYASQLMSERASGHVVASRFF